MNCYNITFYTLNCEYTILDKARNTVLKAEYMMNLLCFSLKVAFRVEVGRIVCREVTMS